MSTKNPPHITISLNNLEAAEVDREEHARQCLHEASDANATIARPSKEERSKSSPSKLTLRRNHRDYEERRKRWKDNEQFTTTTMRAIRRHQDDQSHPNTTT
jgi:hypothetical protein